MLMAYVAWYGLGRMFIEGLRTDSLMLGPIRISQLIGALCFLAGVGFMTLCWILTARGKAPKFLRVNWAEPATETAENETPDESEEN